MTKNNFNYLATFPAGCYEIVVRTLKSFSLDEFKIIEHDNSSVMFESCLTAERLIELRFFTNVYLIVDDSNKHFKSQLKGKFFRLMGLSDGEPKSIDEAEKASIETQIKTRFVLEPNTHLSMNNFYLIERTSGVKALTLCLSRAKFKREKLSAGELRPELANILCLAAGVKAKDVVLDMFAGYGAIPFEAVRGFGCKDTIAVDSSILPNRHENPSIKWHKADADKLEFITDNSINRVVTDPPWGIYSQQKSDELTLLYNGFIRELERVLKPGGIAVVLTGWVDAKQNFELANSFKLINSWNILVSGKKATIYKLQKVSS